MSQLEILCQRVLEQHKISIEVDYSLETESNVDAPANDPAFRKAIDKYHIETNKWSVISRESAPLMAKALLRLKKGMIEAGETICGEFCSRDHHPRCKEVTKALQDVEKILGASK